MQLQRIIERPLLTFRLLLFVLFSCIFSSSCSQNSKPSVSQEEDKRALSVANETDDQNLPTYKLTMARSLSTSPELLNLNEPGREGTFRLDEADNSSVDNGATVFVTKKGKRYKRVFDNEINVHWFGAKGNGTNDDREAIQKTINYAKTLSAKQGGTYRHTIVFPAGFYFISSPIDVTNANGIWLKGSSGRYINTGFIGETKEAMLDFSGSTMSGCEGFTFLSIGSSNNRSTVGVLFALTDKGGLNCTIKNCYFKLESYPKANNGLGTIGILNIRSEEFNVSDCVINANTPIILSNDSNLSDVNINTTITSQFAQITKGKGSMGVISLGGQMSLQSIEKYQPALILNGTNTVKFDGYIGRTSQSEGTDGPAIFCSQSTSNLTINATIESYSQALQIKTSLIHALINLVSANVTDATKPIINVTNASLVDGLTLKVHLPIIKERVNRYLLYHAPINSGDDPVKTRFINSEVYCSELTHNQYIITKNLLRAADNIEFNTNQAFSKKGGIISQCFNNKQSCGKLGSVDWGPVIRFYQCDRSNKKTNNGGFYTIKINGVIRGGSYGSGGSCTQRFVATITISQSQNGNQDSPSSTVTLLDKSQVSPAYIDITSLKVNVTFSEGIGTVKIRPTVSGNGVGEVVTYQGSVELLTDFLVNDTVIFI